MHCEFLTRLFDRPLFRPSPLPSQLCMRPSSSKPSTRSWPKEISKSGEVYDIPPLTTNSGGPKRIPNYREERLVGLRMCEIVKIRISIEMRFDIIRDGVGSISLSREKFMKFPRSNKVLVRPKNVRKPSSSGFRQHFRKGPYL